MTGWYWIQQNVEENGRDLFKTDPGTVINLWIGPRRMPETDGWRQCPIIPFFWVMTQRHVPEERRPRFGTHLPNYRAAS
jgi:hypothetical protein